MTETEQRLLADLAAQNIAAAELEQLSQTDTTLADIEAIAKRQAEFYEDFYQSLKEKNDERI